MGETLSFFIKTAGAIGIVFVLLLWGCQNSDSSPNASSPENDVRLIGTWHQIRLGIQDVSDRNVRLIITAGTLTMAAPGCQISGEYTTTDDQIRFKITAADGERCEEGQSRGKIESARYRISDSQLTLIHRSGEMEIQTIFKRADDSQNT
ncbi:MAG: hypothetical protein PVF09_03065 [Desulfobacterales bacterium]